MILKMCTVTKVAQAFELATRKRAKECTYYEYANIMASQ
jgi:hypothetical protein